MELYFERVDFKNYYIFCAYAYIKQIYNSLK